LVWNPQIIVVLPARLSWEKWFGIHKYPQLRRAPRELPERSQRSPETLW
jgi:hypothetical protein